MFVKGRGTGNKTKEQGLWGGRGQVEGSCVPWCSQEEAWAVLRHGSPRLQERSCVCGAGAEAGWRAAESPPRRPTLPGRWVGLWSRARPAGPRSVLCASLHPAEPSQPRGLQQLQHLGREARVSMATLTSRTWGPRTLPPAPASEPGAAGAGIYSSCDLRDVGAAHLPSDLSSPGHQGQTSAS